MPTLQKHIYSLLKAEVNQFEIKYLEAKNNYTIVYLANGKAIYSAINLLKFENVLKQYQNFRRIHRGYIVNMDYVKSVDPEIFSVTMVEGPELTISRRKLGNIG